MSKVIISFLFLFIFIYFFVPKKALAVESCQSKDIRINFEAGGNKNIDRPKIGVGKPFRVIVKIPEKTTENNWQYYITIRIEPVAHIPVLSGGKILGSTPNSGTETIGGKRYRVFHWDFPDGLPSGGTSIQTFGRSDYTEYRVFLEHAEIAGYSDVCDGPPSQIKTINSALTQIESCPLTMSSNYQAGTAVTGSVSLKSLPDITYYYRLDSGDISSKIPLKRDNPALGKDWVGGVGSTRISPGTNVPLPTRSNLDIGKYTASVFAATGSGLDLAVACGHRVVGVFNEPTSTPTTSGGTVMPTDKGEGVDSSGLSPEDGGPTTSAAGIPCESNGILTSLGCISTDPADFVRGILRLALGIGGGVAFLLMVFGSIQMVTSAGNPDALKGGQERFRDAIIGLLFVIFATLLLKIIGVDILGFDRFFGP